MTNLEALREQFFGTLTRYRYLATLGRGGMGAVFRALDLELNEEVALKVLAALFQDDPEALLARFKRELSLARRVKHPNVARVYDFAMNGPYPYITMELVQGRDLGKHLAEEGPFAPLRAVSVLRQIALGTAAAHQEGIVHRDLKPQNIMLDDEDGVAILDFGMARGKLSPGITLLGTAVGTPQYMSPEQARGRPVDARSDIYAIGVIAFEMLTGSVPFDGDSPMAVAVRHVEEAAPLEKLQGSPEPLCAIVRRCLAKEPAERFGSAVELEASLAILGGLSSVRRALGKGAEAPEPLPADLQLVSDSLDPARPPHVLVVDDERMVRDLIGIYLEQSGCVPVMAGTGEEALARLMEGPVDLVLLDVQMPVMDGFDTLRVVRQNARFERLPVLLMSSFLERNRLAFAIQSGATDFVPKPLEMPHLVEKVWGLLTSRGFARSDGKRRTP